MPRPLRRDLLPALRQAGVDPCGERGEYHTLVTRTPLFSRPLAGKDHDISGARERFDNEKNNTADAAQSVTVPCDVAGRRMARPVLTAQLMKRSAGPFAAVLSQLARLGVVGGAALALLA